MTGSFLWELRNTKRFYCYIQVSDRILARKFKYISCFCKSNFGSKSRFWHENSNVLKKKSFVKMVKNGIQDSLSQICFLKSIIDIKSIKTKKINQLKGKTVNLLESWEKPIFVSLHFIQTSSQRATLEKGESSKLPIAKWCCYTLRYTYKTSETEIFF